MSDRDDPSQLASLVEQLVEQLVGGQLDRDAHAQLARILNDNAAARRQYLELLNTHSQLRSEFGAASDLDEATILGRAKSDQPSATSVAHGTPRSKKSLLDRASRRPVRPALAIAALVMISVVAWMGVTMVKTQIAGGGKSTDEQQKPTKPEFVAWLMKAHETEWLDDTEPQKTRLMPGQRLAISKGLIEIQYRTRAVVVIEGPAEFFVGSSAVGNAVPGVPQRHRGRSLQDDAANSGYLALGKLTARVEGEKAKGFTIDTPSARVEDHGTEFGVEVDNGGDSEFVVLSGKVDVIREASGGRSAQRIRLTKDQGAFVAANGSAIRRRKKVDERLIAAYRERFDVLLAPTSIPATHTFLSSTTHHKDRFIEDASEVWYIDERATLKFTGDKLNGRIFIASGQSPEGDASLTISGGGTLWVAGGADGIGSLRLGHVPGNGVGSLIIRDGSTVRLDDRLFTAGDGGVIDIIDGKLILSNNHLGRPWVFSDFEQTQIDLRANGVSHRLEEFVFEQGTGELNGFTLIRLSSQASKNTELQGETNQPLSLKPQLEVNK